MGHRGLAFVLLASPVLVTLAGGGCGGDSQCGFDGCTNQVAAVATATMTPGHKITFTVCRMGQCATGTLVVMETSTSASLPTPSADCQARVGSNGFDLSCVPRGPALQTGEAWSMWAADDGTLGDGGVPFSAVLLDVKGSIVVTPSSGRCGAACPEVTLR